MAVQRLSHSDQDSGQKVRNPTTRPCDSQSADEQFWATIFGSCEARTRMLADSIKSIRRWRALSAKDRSPTPMISSSRYNLSGRIAVLMPKARRNIMPWVVTADRELWYSPSSVNSATSGTSLGDFPLGQSEEHTPHPDVLVTRRLKSISDVEVGEAGDPPPNISDAVSRRIDFSHYAQQRCFARSIRTNEGNPVTMFQM